MLLNEEDVTTEASISIKEIDRVLRMDNLRIYQLFVDIVFFLCFQYFSVDEHVTNFIRLHIFDISKVSFSESDFALKANLLLFLLGRNDTQYFRSAQIHIFLLLSDAEFL